MSAKWKQIAAAGLLILAVTAGSVSAAPIAKGEIPEVAAVVNGENIPGAELAAECLRQHGEEILERLINKYLIKTECDRLRIAVTPQEVRDEIERMATKFGYSVEEWLRLIKTERGLSADEYANEVVWSLLALKKLANDDLQIPDAEIQAEFESRFGPKVQVRMIQCRNAQHGAALLQRLSADPDAFEQLAKTESTDQASAAMGGLIYPVRRNAGPKEIEDAVFALKEGQISNVVVAAGHHLIFRCEQHFKGIDAQINDKIKNSIAEELRAGKLEQAAKQIVPRLQAAAVVVNVFNNSALQQQHPGVAAIVNGQEIKTAELAKLAVARHGEDVLQDMIHHRLLIQECRRENIRVTREELVAEIAKVAKELFPLKPDGSPDIAQCIRVGMAENRMSEETYLKTIVWPRVALNKLVGKEIVITKEDLDMGFKAHYGARVRCLAIVLDNLRRAQEVWEKARENPSREHFANLATEYSIEPQSSALGGVVPPIQQNGGQSELELEAFKLNPGELSAIVQVGPGRYVILFCLGQTEPIDVTLDDVRQDLWETIYMQKLQVKIVERFEQINELAAIDNYLTGTSQAPQSTRRSGAVLDPVQR